MALDENGWQVYCMVTYVGGLGGARAWDGEAQQQAPGVDMTLSMATFPFSDRAYMEGGMRSVANRCSWDIG